MEQPIEQQVSALTSLLMNDILFPSSLAKYEEEVRQHLRDPGLLNWVSDVLDCRIVGEKLTKLLLFLVALSYKANDPQGVIIQGPPSIGKSWLCKNVLRLFPNVLNLTRVTMAFFDRTGADLDHYILYITELGGQEQATPTLRVMLSEGELTLGTVDVGQHGPTPKVIQTKGSPVYVTTTTKELIEPQLAARTWLLTPDSSEEQTRHILRYQAERAKKFIQEGYSHKEMVLRALIYALKDFDVLVPYASELSELFPVGEYNARRDFKRLLSLIKCIALLFQRQRLKLKLDGGAAIIAGLSDLLMATWIIKPVMLPTLYSLPQKALDFIRTFEQNPDVEYTARSMGAEHHLSQKRARDILNGLMDRGFAYRDTARKPYRFEWSEKTLEEGTIFSIARLSDFFPSEAFENWLKPDALSGYQMSKHTDTWEQIINVNIPELYEKFMLPHPRVNSASLSEAKEDVKLEKEPERRAIPQIAFLPKTLTVQETLTLMRSTWKKGLYGDFDALIIKTRDCSRRQAERIREQWLDENLLCYDPEGLLMWLK